MTKIPKNVEKEALDKVQAQITRATAPASKQPRLDPDGKNAASVFWEIYRWTKNMIFEEPKYSANSVIRDRWLALAVQQEPYLLGIMQSIISIDKNRGWTLIGGRNQVQKFTGILHGFQVAPDLSGWRAGLSVTAQNYYQSDLGGVVEIGRSQKDGPLAALYTVDPTRCRLTGKPDFPLNYNGKPWGINDYFRVVSMPSPDENMHGLGRCFASRAIELAKLMVSVFEHYREKMMSKAPRGLLLINGITQEQWLASLEQSQAELSEVHRAYYAGVQTLASSDGVVEMSAEMVSLSTLPQDFDYQSFVNMIIFGYALEAGYDPREFWPVSTGTMGSATESQQQHRKSSSKGGLDFSLNFQEKIQDELPETLQFEFEQRDVQGDMLEVEYSKAKADLVKSMYQAVNAQMQNLITLSEARQLLVENQLIPEEWTLPQENITVTDTQDTGQALQLDSVQRALKAFPDQDIVRYSFKNNKTRTIIPAGQQKRFQLRVIHPVMREKPKVLASNKAVTITQADVEKAIAAAEGRFGKKAKKMLMGVDRTARRKHRSDDYEAGQLCPYQDCCHDLAIPSAGWYSCGCCRRKLYARDSDSDYEDYACYREERAEEYNLPSIPANVPTARDLGPSWASPESKDANAPR